MGTPAEKEFGPGYDYPNRTFHFWAVILPTVLIVTLTVILMRHTGSASSQVSHNPIVTCPAQMCRPAGAADPATPARSAGQASGAGAGLGTAYPVLRDKNASTDPPARGGGSGQASVPSPSSNSVPTVASSSPSSTDSPAPPVLSVTRALLGQAPPATHAVVLSSA